MSALTLGFPIKLNEVFTLIGTSDDFNPVIRHRSGIPFAMSNLEHSERRLAARRTCLLSGSIRFQTRNSTLTCRLRNLSETGARIQIINSYWIPDRFELEISHHDIRVPAKVIWRSAEELGIKFESNRRGMMTSARQEERVVQLEAERERLQRRVRQLSEE